MSDFVNYNKRDVKLPPGCKDLIDVLRGRRVATRDYSVNGPVSDIAEHVRTIFGSTALFVCLDIAPADETSADILRDNERNSHVFIRVQRASDQERAVRGFLSSRGLKAPEDSQVPKGVFYPDLPVSIGCEISPLPPTSTEVARLLTDLFRHLGFTEDVVVRYSYCELVV